MHREAGTTHNCHIIRSAWEFLPFLQTRNGPIPEQMTIWAERWWRICCRRPSTATQVGRPKQICLSPIGMVIDKSFQFPAAHTGFSCKSFQSPELTGASSSLSTIIPPSAITQPPRSNSKIQIYSDQNGQEIPNPTRLERSAPYFYVWFIEPL
jgi:hypothetical protein